VLLTAHPRAHLQSDSLPFHACSHFPLWRLCTRKHPVALLYSMVRFSPLHHGLALHGAYVASIVQFHTLCALQPVAMRFSAQQAAIARGTCFGASATAWLCSPRGGRTLLDNSMQLAHWHWHMDQEHGALWYWQQCQRGCGVAEGSTCGSGNSID
jgi:hypothetical protein